MMPKFLTPEQKEILMDICADILQTLKSPKILENVITCDYNNKEFCVLHVQSNTTTFYLLVQ